VDESYISRRFVMITLAVLFAVGLALRLYNIEGFPPHVDEYHHTSRAQDMIAGIPNDYMRAFLTVTLPVYLSFRLLGVSIWSARLPLILINMLALFPFYLLGRRFGRSMGLVFACFYVFSPWSIATARTVREYAVHPLLAYVIAVLLLELLDWDGIPLRKYLGKNLYRILGLAVLFLYIMVDRSSTFKSQLLAYVVFGVIVFIKVLKSNLSRRVTAGALVLVVSLPVVLLLTQSHFYKRYLQDGTFAYEQTSRYWDMIVSGGSQHGYVYGDLGYIIVGIFLVLSLLILLSKYSRKNFTLLFIFVTLSLNLAYLTYFVWSPTVSLRTRYGWLAEIWYIPLVAVTAWLIGRVLSGLMKKKHPVVFLAVTLTLFINLPSIQQILSYQGGGYAPVTGNPHYIVAPARDYLASVLTDKDVVVGDIIFHYDRLTGNKLIYAKQINYPFRDDTFDPFAVVEQYDRGYIAVSPHVRPESDGLIFQDIEHAGRTIRYLGEYGDYHIWRWDGDD
jgi:hypothetical protein